MNDKKQIEEEEIEEEVDDTSYSVNEAIDALLEELGVLGLDFIEGSMLYDYNMDEGQRVTLLSNEIPNFILEDGNPLLLTRFEWQVEEIKPADTDEDEEMNIYQTVFYLEDVI